MNHKIGDKVYKKPNAGFVGEPLDCIIADVPENHDPVPCFLCDDDQCKEWPTLYVVDEETKEITGCVCHVSDCQLQAKTKAVGERKL